MPNGPPAATASRVAAASVTGTPIPAPGCFAAGAADVDGVSDRTGWSTRSINQAPPVFASRMV